jgi:hypothetical protein
MKAKVIAILLMGFVLSAPATAKIWQLGAATCGQWGKEQTQVDKAWLLGYLSGVALTTKKNFLDGIDDQSIFLWMDNYCQLKPLSHVYNGADVLIFELRKRKGL